MTYRARMVLDDCRLALELLEQSPNDQFWRVHWFAAIGLVRAVGDVLRKVDGVCPKQKQLIAEAYQRWKADKDRYKIFWQFIKHERDRVIHEYESGVHPLGQISLAFRMNLVCEDSEELKTIEDVAELDSNIYRPLLEGPWEGDDARDVLQEAIDWWETELNKIENEIKK